MLLLAGFLARFAAELFFPYKPYVYYTTTKKLIGVFPDPMFFGYLLASQSFFLFAVVYFRKNAILNAILFLAFLIFMFLLIIKITGIGHFVVPLVEYTTRLKYQDLDSIDIVSYILEFKYEWFYSKVLFYIVTVFFWILSYLRLKETEV
jgi:hypothetical protein